MNEVLGSILPNAVAIAISPIPIIAVILMLMSPQPRPLGLSFLAGWFLGVALVTTAVTLLAGVIPEPDGTSGSQPVIGVIQLVLGVLLILLGVRQWRSRPAPGTDPELPAWMSKIDTMKPLAALLLALTLAALNPKNLLAASAAGTVIGRASLDVGAMIVALAGFTVVAALTVAVPVLFAVFAPTQAAPVLAGIRTWLAANNATIMTVVLVVLGAQVLGKGIGAF
ncbi:MAG: GAP family protein [Actinobacteria bacterium]|nr:GAP family protein [Actinomycetota bacterium]